MESTNRENIFSSLEFDYIGRQHIEAIAHWAMIIAIIGIVSNLIGLAMAFSTSAELSEFAAVLGNSFGASRIFYLLISGFSIMINVFLLLFAKNAKAASRAGDGAGIGQSFSHLKTYFMIMAILLIIAVSMAVLVIFLGLMAS